MSRLSIVHETTYRYRRPVAFGPHRLVLRPREGHDVDVVSMKLVVTPSFSVRWARDVFGNSIATLSFHEPHDVLRIRSEVVLDRAADADEPHEQLGSAPYPVAYSPLEAHAAAVYLSPSYADDEEAVRSFVASVGVPSTGDAASALPALNAAIHAGISYRRREERGTQSPAQTIALGTGSCRDKATLLLDAARALGIAARFVSGYLDCPASEAGRAATHAWVEVYLPESGWCGFDPTLGERTSHKHVVVAASNHPRGVMPIAGTFEGGAGDYVGLDVSVTIRQLDAGTLGPCSGSTASPG